MSAVLKKATAQVLSFLRRDRILYCGFLLICCEKMLLYTKDDVEFCGIIYKRWLPYLKRVCYTCK